MPVNHRRPRWPAVGRGERISRRRISVHFARSVARRRSL